MKKILSIALVAALLVSSVFAASFTGDATLSLGYDLDTKEYGFANGKSTTLKFGFELGSGDGASAGEGDLRAEIAGAFKVEFKEAKHTKAEDLKLATISTLKISKANILYKDFLTVGILGAGSSANYAASYYTNDDGDPESDKITALNGVAGFNYTVKAEKFSVKGGFGLTGNAEAETYKVLAHAAVADLAVAEEVKVSAAVATLLTDSSKALQANVKGSYEKDLFSASAAFDISSNLDDAFGLEAALAAKYDFVTLDVYFFSLDTFNTNNLDAKLAAEKTFGEDVKVTVKASVDARDIINDAREITPALDASCTVDAFTFGAKASYGIMGKKLALEGNVKYAHEMFTAKAGVKFSTTVESENTSVLSASASIESTKLINGATVSLAYAADKTTNYLAENTKLGKVTAAVKVAF